MFVNQPSVFVLVWVPFVRWFVVPSLDLLFKSLIKNFQLMKNIGINPSTKHNWAEFSVKRIIFSVLKCLLNYFKSSCHSFLINLFFVGFHWSGTINVIRTFMLFAIILFLFIFSIFNHLSSVSEKKSLAIEHFICPFL